MAFHIVSKHLNGIVVLGTDIHHDDRGFFMETYRADQFRALGLPGDFVQDNHSRSRRGVVRGLHFQWQPAMAKIMRVTAGRAFLVAVDIRSGSPTLGEWFGIEASAENRLQLYAPAGFARGFCVVSDEAEIQYKCTAVYNPAGEGGIRWNDPEIGIAWPVSEPLLSPKDDAAPTLRQWLAGPQAGMFHYDPPPVSG